jgi:glycosyltransferase involved in cell wall biosynthesis
VTDYAVLITTYQRPAECLRAVRSVLGQTVTPARVVVVDDASTDPGYEAIRRLGDLVELISLQRNSRAALNVKYANGAVRNVGLFSLLASGFAGWIAFLDDDDEWMPDKVAQQLRAARPGYELLATNAINRNPEGATIGLHHRPAGVRLADGVADVTAEVELDNPIIHSSAMVSTRVAELVGMQKATGYPEDHDYWRRCVAHTKALRLDMPLVYYSTGNPKHYAL